MIHEKIDLSEDGRVYMKTYIHDRSSQLWDNVGQWQPDLRPSVLVLPGGAYQYCSDREAEPVVFPFLTAGFNAFVLFYSVAEHSVFPFPLEDVSRAVWEIRKHKETWQIDQDKIAVGGFSAGGNLAAMLGTQWNTPGLAEKLDIPKGGNKPNAIFLCYALTGIESHMLKAPPADPGVKFTPPGAIMAQNTEQLNVFRYVSKNASPAFIWHSLEDEQLSIDNPLLLVQAYAKNNIPFELHIFQHGRHGTSINTDLSSYGQEQPVNVASWVPLCINWLKALF
jgi:acetyl esterase/lipase